MPSWQSCEEAITERLTTNVPIIITRFQTFTLPSRRRSSRRSVGFRLGTVEDPVDDVEHGEDDWEALSRQFVDAPSVVLAVVRRRRRRGKRGRQRAGHDGHRLLRLLLLRLGGRRRRLVVPVMRRRLGGGQDAGTGGSDERLVDARDERDAVHAAAASADHGRVADGRVRATVTSSQSVLHTRTTTSYIHPTLITPADTQ